MLLLDHGSPKIGRAEGFGGLVGAHEGTEKACVPSDPPLGCLLNLAGFPHSARASMVPIHLRMHPFVPPAWNSPPLSLRLHGQKQLQRCRVLDLCPCSVSQQLLSGAL